MERVSNAEINRAYDMYRLVLEQGMAWSRSLEEDAMAHMAAAPYLEYVKELWATQEDA